MQGKYADIIIDITSPKLEKVFQYRIPESLRDRIRPGMVVQVPFGRTDRLMRGYVLSLSDTCEIDPDRIKDIGCLSSDLPDPKDHLVSLALWMKDRYACTLTQAFRTVLPVKKKVRPTEERSLRLAVSREEAGAALAVMNRKHHTARARLLETLLQTETVSWSFVTGRLGISASVIKALEEKGYIVLSRETHYRIPVGTEAAAAQNCGTESSGTVLTAGQLEAVRAVLPDIKADKAEGRYLLYGVTGSGKTMVYLHLAMETVKRGKQVIVLIPEIALTYQTVMRFYQAFHSRVSFIHSRLSDGERYDQFLRAAAGEIDVMIGPRSALFTPFRQLGLIVIDEEHERSYKSETVPRYHAREVACFRASHEGAVLVLGSATPSLESYHEALAGKMKLLRLTSRASGAAMPQTQIVDMRREGRCGNTRLISGVLQEQIRETLANGQQAMLFLNRRGYAGFISCRNCGHVMTCPHCDVSLTLHEQGTLMCHYCGYETRAVRICPECGSAALRSFRAGTEQIQEETAALFPEARILRMDADTTKTKDSHSRILSAFAAHEADILIGTQMIVKGHDFPRVTLMGILAADLSLFAPDFRAAEQTFQLITQAGGRAGRADAPGRVVIQTYEPEHYSIRYASQGDYEKFYEEEIDFREAGGYPPCAHMTAIHVSGADPERLELAMGYLRQFALRVCTPRNIRVLGPADEPVAKLQDVYRKVMYLKHPDPDVLQTARDNIRKYIAINDGFKSLLFQYEED